MTAGGHAEHQAVADLVDQVVAGLPHPLPDHEDTLADARRQLAGVGVWTLGVPESIGGGGADQGLTNMVFSRLGRSTAALGWAAVQAHAAAELLADGGIAELSAGLQRGDIAFGVLDGPETSGVLRVDAAAERPFLIALGAQGATLYRPDDMTLRPLRRTGLPGAATAQVQLHGLGIALSGARPVQARIRLRMGAAAVAAGIAGAAAEHAARYCGQREQFGAALTELPTVREALLAQEGSAQSLLRQVLYDGPVRPDQAAALLDLACEGAIYAAATAVQLHGGYGYLAEYPVEGLLRDAVSLRAACQIGSIGPVAAGELVGS